MPIRWTLILIATLVAVVGVTGAYLVTNPAIFGGSSDPPQGGVAIPDERPRPNQLEVPDPRADVLINTVEEHFRKFEAKNIRAENNGLLADYVNSRSTSVHWTRQAGIYTGTYQGYSTIIILYSQVLGNTVSINITVSDYKAIIEGDSATTTMRLFNTGEGKLVGDFEMEVNVAIKWIFQDGKWLITNEEWEFTLFKTSEVAEGTVFPLHWSKRGDYSVWDEWFARIMNR